MNTSNDKDKSEFYYLEEGEKKDAGLHDEMLSSKAGESLALEAVLKLLPKLNLEGQERFFK